MYASYGTLVERLAEVLSLLDVAETPIATDKEFYTSGCASTLETRLNFRGVLVC